MSATRLMAKGFPSRGTGFSVGGGAGWNRHAGVSPRDVATAATAGVAGARPSDESAAADVLSTGLPLRRRRRRTNHQTADIASNHRSKRRAFNGTIVSIGTHGEHPLKG